MIASSGCGANALIVFILPPDISKVSHAGTRFAGRSYGDHSAIYREVPQCCHDYVTHNYYHSTKQAKLGSSAGSSHLQATTGGSSESCGYPKKSSDMSHFLVKYVRILT
jgi:hypothetical protein